MNADRLTERDAHNYPHIKAVERQTCARVCEIMDEVGEDCNYCVIQQAVERLTEYEDTGLTPGEIKALQGDMDSRRAEPAGAGWKRCEEGYPDGDQVDVLIFREREGIDIGFADANGHWWETLTGWQLRLDDVTHWHPLPKPPERSDGDVR